MRVVERPDAATLWREVEPYLARDPANNTHQLSAIKRILDLGARHGERFFTVLDPAGEIAASAVIVDTRTMFLALMTSAAAQALAQHINEQQIVLAGAIGRNDVLAAFTGTYSRPSSVLVDLMLYRLEQTPDFGRATGEWRIADEHDQATLVAWHAEFETEVHMIAVPTPIEERVARRIRDAQLMLWCDGGKPVSFAGFNALPAASARIGPVYTPPALRTRGYAQAVTAAASAHLQQDGPRTVFLFTDASNPASNKAYQRIGFRHIADHAHLLFDAAG